MELTGTSGFSSSKLDSYTLRTNKYDLFQPVTYSTEVESWLERDFYPLLLNQTGPYEIPITGDGTHFLDLQHARLEMWLKYEFVKANDPTTVEKLSGKFDASAVPLLGTSMFKVVRIKVGNINIPEITQDMYAYKSYLETLLESRSESLDDYLYPKLGQFDYPGTYLSNEADFRNFNSITGTEVSGNKVYNSKVPKETRVRPVWVRQALLADNNPYFISSPLHIDCFTQHKYFPPNASFSLIFEKHNDEFFLLSHVPADKYKVKFTIDKMRVKVPMLKLSDSITNNLMNRWKREPAIYYFQHIVPRTYHITPQTEFFEEHNLSRGILPKSLYFVIVDNANFNGRFTHSPFLFEHLSITSFELSLNGHILEHFRLEPDFDKEGLYMYEQYLKNTKGTTQHANIVSPSYYKTDYSIFAFDLSKDFNNNWNIYPPQYGTLGLKIKFPKVTRAKVIIAFFVYTKAMTIDYNLDCKVTEI